MTREEMYLAERIYEDSFYDPEYDKRNGIKNNKQKVIDIIEKFLEERKELNKAD